MKRNFVIFLTIFFFILLLVFPANVFAGTSSGLLLWFNTVLPTLLPFIIATNLLINTPALDWISKISGSFLSRIFHVSKTGSFVILAGFLCGYPMGSKMTADLLRRNQLSYEEACYLLSFCNNTSPMFLISYILYQSLENCYAVIPSLIIFMLSPVLCSFFFYHFFYKKKLCYKEHMLKQRDNPKDGMSENLIDSCIMNGFETITKIGGYIMIFSIFIELLKSIPVQNPYFTNLFLPSLEITNGITILANTLLPMDFKYILCLFHTAFGGWCSIAQTQCMIQGTGLKLTPYIIEKLITATVTSLFAIIYIRFIL